MKTFLDEEKANKGLEQMMKEAEDRRLKAKTPEEIKAASEECAQLHRIYNDRLKIENDRYVQEARNELDLEKMKVDQERAERNDIEEAKSKRKDRWIKVGLKAAEIGVVVAGIGLQAIIIHNNLIETDGISKGVSRGIFGRIGDYLRT